MKQITFLGGEPIMLSLRKVLSLALVLCLLITTLASCAGVSQKNIALPLWQSVVDEHGNRYLNADENPALIEQLSAGEKTDRSEWNKSGEQIKDEEGNFIVPFDRAYPEVFENENVEYDKEHALLKLSKNAAFVMEELTVCGFDGVEKFLSTEKGDWYRAKVASTSDVVSAVNKARNLDFVLMADFDYITRAEAVEVDPSENGLMDHVLENPQVTDQWYLTYSEIQRSWRFLEQNGSQAGGDSSVVVAVIDTGVDYNHPDLKANMWVNMGEIPDNGIDDDGNGYIDDIYGCSTIGNSFDASGDPMDDHGHGTHVAGIIGASNNREGIVGIAYNAKIMAIKAGQASGVFNQSDIAEAILYAYEMGADVINMSFGGSACSIAVQDALSTAYTRSTLVASAGNNGYPNEPMRPIYPVALPNYPAALSYVIGVMSVNEQGVESGFTNFDKAALNSVEYEIYAPGEAMLSTLPNGRYGKLSGTSMAAPVVAASAALLRSYFKDRDMYPSKFIAAQLSATSGDQAICSHGVRHNVPMILNTYDALTKLPKPDISLYNYYLFDSESIAEGNNGDGVIDAGETVNIGAVLRNRWGMSKDTIVTIDANTGIEGLGLTNPYVEIINGTSNFEGVGTYSTKDQLIRENNTIVVGTDEPLTVRIADNCPNDYLIVLNVTITYKNGLDEDDLTLYSSKDKKQLFTVEFGVRKGVVLPSVIREDMMLTKENYYIIPNSTYIPEGVTVTVKEGTQIQFWSDDPQDPYADTSNASLSVAGKLICQGTEQEMVKLFPSELCNNRTVVISRKQNGNITINYAMIDNPELIVNRIDHCTMERIGNRIEKGNLRIDASIIENSVFKSYFPYYDQKIIGCVFCDGGYFNTTSLENCVIFNKKNRDDSQYRYSLMIPSFGDVFKDPSTGTTYFQQMFSIDEPSLATHNNIASVFGGHVAWIETEDEKEFFKSYYLSSYSSVSGALDLKRGDTTWPNGVEVIESIANTNKHVLNAISESNKYLTYGGGELMYSNNCLHALIEIPGNIGCDGVNLYERDPHADDGFQWTVELLYQMYLNQVKKNMNNKEFKGNAVLNDFNETDVYRWFRITSVSEYIPNYTSSVAGNYWGTTDERMIERQIVDFDDNANLADIVVGEYLTTPPSNTFPFVMDAYLLDRDGNRQFTVTNDTYTFVVEFNRDMDTTVPLRVRFGSSEPYGEYEIDGEFVNPRRWEGVYTLKTTIENGNQFFNIENGRAADDHFMALYDTPSRFMFEIDTTAAQALIMQGSATPTGINLTWEQDDFDTLAGYNVYRSDKEDGLYTRLNNVVIPADTKEFFDDTVEPGKVYYYNFTVVQSDMQESEPSGKIVIMSMDTMAPNIYHSPVRTAYTGSNLVVGATITDNLKIDSATLYYRAVGTAEWKSTVMTANNSRYTAIIPADALSLDGMEYYIDAFDGISHTFKGSTENAFAVTVKLAVDRNALGDVDGNGIIEIKDALMLLQAANDRLNLTEGQFLRADINGDNELSAAEALRIMQYVSGKVTTIQF